jgi:hypothetical protein
VGQNHFGNLRAHSNSQLNFDRARFRADGPVRMPPGWRRVTVEDSLTIDGLPGIFAYATQADDSPDRDPTEESETS